MEKIVREADKLYNNKDYDNALAGYLSALKYSNKAPVTQMKIAKVYSLKMDGSNSLKHFIESLRAGFNNFDEIHQDNDLAYLRNLPEFQTLAARHFQLPESDSPGKQLLGTVDELEKLSTLLEKGFITKEEFDTQKRKLLNQ